MVCQRTLLHDHDPMENIWSIIDKTTYKGLAFKKTKEVKRRVLVNNYDDEAVARTSPLRPHLYGLGYPRQPSPRVTLAEVTFSLFLCKIQPTVYIRILKTSRGASCLASAGRVLPANGTTFLEINALARLT